jgi:nicotinamide phosphoribosyltransferase
MKYDQHNIILSSDSYKYSQFNQYPPGTEYVYSYIESRGSDEYDELVFVGVQAFIREYLTTPVTRAMVDEAAELMLLHGEPFNREGWMYIVNVCGGLLPVEIKSVDEGTIMPLKNILVSIVNTDPKCYWLPSFLETALLRAIWYPTTVASNSYTSKKYIMDSLNRSGDPTQYAYKLNDFGSRGVSSQESSALGGLAHLVNFAGTDNVLGLRAAMAYYDSGVIGHSIPAMEHSTVTSWGRNAEVEAYRNMLKHYAKPGTLLACVSDSYDIRAACKMWGTELKQEVIDSGAIVVIRPDSGTPEIIVVECLNILAKYFGTTTNAKGFRVLNNVRVIQGDGINHASIRRILFCVELAGFSSDNVAFGQGGALLQAVDRDKMKFAMKCSAIGINRNGKLEWTDVFKDPITDPGKKSKKGRMMLVKEDNQFKTIPLDWARYQEDLLKIRFKDGFIKNETTFAEVKERAHAPFVE